MAFEMICQMGGGFLDVYVLPVFVSDILVAAGCIGQMILHSVYILSVHLSPTCSGRMSALFC